MIGLFTRQLQAIKTLIAVLESRGILEHGDIPAFGALIHAESNLSQETLDQARVIYHSLCMPLGIQTGLEPPKASA
jgi:hypothetical protein